MGYAYEFTVDMVRALQEIERAQEIVCLTVLPLVVAERLRLEGQVRITHFSIQIEGNRLTLEEAAAVIERDQRIPGRERGVGEVVRYYLALQQIETWVADQQALTEPHLCKLHAVL